MFNTALFILLLLLFLVTITICIVIILSQKRKFQITLANNKKLLLSSRRINQILLEDLNFNVVAQKVADTIPDELDFGTGVLSILDDKRGVIKRTIASRTPEAIAAVNLLEKINIPFRSIEIPVNDPNNLMAKALREHRSYITEDVYNVLGPILTPQQAHKVQEIMSTNTTFIYPLYMRDKPLGVFIASTSKYKNQISDYELEVLNNFASLVGLCLQNSKLYTSLELVTRQLGQANARLQELDKLKDDFVSVASHELRTPMTAIRSYVWMALNRPDIPLSEKLKKYLSRTLISTERLINLVNDMLNVSRIESGRIEITPSSFDIRKLADDVILDILPKVQEKNIKINVSKENLPNIFADQEKVHQVLMNLLGNALKFTPQEGSININFFTDGKVLEASVKDSGVGISKEDLSRLFTKFGRLDNSYVAAATSGGTGLGLYIAKSLIDLMGGKIWASSEGSGKGASFTFSLPIATPSVLAQAHKYTHQVLNGQAKSLEPVAI